MVAQNTSSILSKAVGLFRSDLDKFVHKALNERFEDAEAMNKFRLKTLTQRCELKERAQALDLKFTLEYSRAHERVVRAREELERQRQVGTEAV